MNAVARLVVDQLRRRPLWTSFGLYGWQVGYFMSGTIPFTRSPLFRNAIALAVPVMIGGIAHSLLRIRPILQLPASRVALWRAEWWLTVPLPAIGFAVFMAIGLAIHGTLTVDTALLPAAYGFVGVACYKRLATGTTIGQRMDAPVNPRSIRSVFLVGMVSVPILLAAPAALAFVLPQRVADLNLIWSAALLGFAALGVSAYFHQPPLTARPSMRVSSRPESVDADVRDARSQVSSRLTGWRMALWIEARRRFLTFATLLAVAIVVAIIVGLFRPVPPLREILSNMDMLPFASRRAHATEVVTWAILLLLSATPEPLRSIDWRALRTQPIRGRDLALLPLVSGILSATTLFAAMAIVHVFAFAGAPVALRTDLFAAVAAVVAFAEMARLFLRSSVLSGMVLLVPISALWLLLGATDTYQREIVQPATLAISLLVLATSVPISRRIFTRSTRLYRARPIVGRVGV